MTRSGVVSTRNRISVPSLSPTEGECARVAPAPRRAVAADVLAAFIVAGALFVQSSALGVPLTGARDTQSAAIAHHLREDGVAGLFYPRGPFSADGAGTALMEFPLVGALGALVRSLLPSLGETAYRVPSMAFSVVAVVAFFTLVRRRFSDVAALAAAALLAFAPVHLELAGSPRPDEGAFALSLLCLALLDRGRVTASAVALSLAILAKSTYVATVIAWVVLLARRDGLRALVSPRALVGLAIAVLPVTFWQLHATRVNAESSLMGSLRVLDAVSDHAWQKGRTALFWAPSWYEGIAARLIRLATPVGTILAVVGAATLVVRPRRGAVDLALAFAAGLAGILVAFPWHSVDQHYYTLPALPLSACLAAVAVDAARGLASRMRLHPAATAALCAAPVVFLAVTSVPIATTRLRATNQSKIAFGDVVRRHVPERSRLIVAAPFIGPWDGSLLYRSGRSGWRYSTTSLDESNAGDVARVARARLARGEFAEPRRPMPFSLRREHRLDAGEIERLRARGASHFAFAGPIEQLRHERPDLVAHLESHARLVESKHAVTIFEL